MAEQTKQILGPSRSCTLAGPAWTPGSSPSSVGQVMAFAPYDFLARVAATAAGGNRAGEFNALAIDDGCAGVGVFFSVSRSAGHRASLIRGNQPLADQRVKASKTVDLGGNSEGSMRHWQPVFKR